jgi:sugar O-acyltransferase (sialic acid O-acetyltransferase NeuD family)
MITKQIIFIGANNPETGRMITALNSLEKNELEFIGFIDNDPQKANTEYLGLPIYGGYKDAKILIKKNVYFVNLITRDCITRLETSKEIYKLGGKFANFIHPTVNLEKVSLGLGNYIQENVIIQANVQIGNNSSIHMSALIGHESIIGNSVFIAHGCNISGLVEIEDCVFLGTGVSVIPRVTIGKFSIIGAGSVIINDVPPYSVVVGNPGRVIKSLEKKYLHGDIDE